MNINRKTVHTDQQGMVSVVVTMIIMIVLTLVVTGFAQLARKEQREALDRQLSTQAYYAAESGINDARKLIQSGALTTNKTDCNPAIPGANNIDSDGIIQYTCLLIRKDLTNLKYQNVLPDKSTIVPIVPVDPATGASLPISELTVNWENKDDGNQVIPPASLFPSFTPYNTWRQDAQHAYTTVLRIEVVPAPTAPNALSAYSLADGDFTVFAYPSTASTTGSVGYSPASVGNQDKLGKIVQANCQTSSVKRCKLTITGLPPSDRYYLRVRPFYAATDIDVCASNGTNCVTTTTLKDAQVEIDSTGKANDILKRIQVRVADTTNTTNAAHKPDFALESGESICKKYSVWPGGGTSDPSCPF